ncbi:hypothetical protein RUND412_002009 [Rhizina undulata]
MARSTNRSRARQNPRGRSLNAFAIASSENPAKPGVPAHRLGQKPTGSKRKRSKKDDKEGEDEDGDDSKRGHSNDGEDSVDDGSDSEGNEWKLGQVDSDDDSDLDSDEAMGESDEERFADFTFRGSSSGKGVEGGGSHADMDLSEGEDEDGEEEEGGEGYIDLSEMLDRPDSEAEEAKPKKQSKKRSVPTDSSGEEDLDLGEDEDESMSSADDESGSEDDNESFTQFSDEEDTPEDPAKLDALESLISSLPTSNSQPAAKRVRLNDPNEGKTPNEYNLSLSSSSKKLTIYDLMPSIIDPKLKKSLKLISDPAKSDSKKGGVLGKLAAPLAKRQQDRLDRAAAYEQSKETLNRWVDTVKHNREADHLHFPLANAPNAPIEPPNRLSAITPNNSTPLTELEAKISGILKESDMVSEKQIQEFEELKSNKMSIEDVQRRTAELRLARELLYREELKAKRIKKIKSKTYRRIHKKERMKEQQAIEDAIRLENGVPDEGEELERERKRAEERMSLRHKQSRWAKGMKESGRTMWDDEARDGAVEMARRNEELSRRIQGKNVHEEDDSDMEDDEQEDSEDGFDEEGDGERETERQRLLNELEKVEQAAKASGGKLGSKLMGMKFMQSAEAAKRKENVVALESLRKDLEDGERESGDESEEEQLGRNGRMIFNPGKDGNPDAPKTHETRGEFEESGGSDEDADEDQQEEEEVQFVNKASAATTSNFKKNPFMATEIPNGKSGNKYTFFNNREDEAEEENPWLPKGTDSTLIKPKAQIISDKLDAKGAKINSKLSKDRKSALKKHQEAQEGTGEVEIDVNMTLQIALKVAEQSKKPRKSSDENEDSDSVDDSEYDDKDIALVPEKGGKATFENQRELVKRAFAGDDIVREFKEEKKKSIEDQGDKIIDETLPGWGNWAGDGISKKQMNRNKGRVLRRIEGIDKDKRKDKKLAKVIINEKRIKKNLKYNAPALPHPFENQQQYERSLRIPIGPEWTTKETFQASTMPRVMVKQGRVVEPMAAPFK